MKIIKVVWLCFFVNKQVHTRIELSFPLWKRILERKNADYVVDEIARWNTNALNEFENFHQVELHVISPYSFMKKPLEEFEINNIHYHIFKNDCSLFFTIKSILLNKLHKEPSWRNNRKVIKKLVKSIQPDIIHVMGAENGFYSSGLLDISDSIPTIVQLQTLLSDPNIIDNYPSLGLRIPLETSVIKKATYIGTSVERFRRIIRDKIKKDAVFIDTDLAITEEPNRADSDKVFDFVYFSSNINKAVDLAIEAFAIAHKSCPQITLDVIGGYDIEYKKILDSRIDELGIKESVCFEGRLPSYNDVIEKVRKAKYALLPLRTDIISSTIREAMANGLPTITTITPGTPSLNKTIESVLLSETGDHQALADNMLKVINDPSLAKRLSDNALIVTANRETNKEITQKWVKAYAEIVGKKMCNEKDFDNNPLIPDIA